MCLGPRVLLRFGEESESQPGLFTAPRQAGVEKNPENTRYKEPYKVIYFNDSQSWLRLSV